MAGVAAEVSGTFWPSYEHDGPGPFVLVLKCGCIESMMLSSDKKTATVMRPGFGGAFLFYGAYEGLKKLPHVVGVRIGDALFDNVRHAEEQRALHAACDES